MLHFSEDPTIERFVPQPPSYYVWAVDHDRAPDYWFPRQCPRAMAWVGAGTSEVDRERIIGVGCGVRVHAIEYAWWDAMRSIRLYAYRFSAAAFRPLVDHAQVATAPVVPLGPAEPVGDLIEAHEAAGIQLRVLANLWPFWDAVTASTVGFSGIRLRNARRRPPRGAEDFKFHSTPRWT